jgi:ABC-type multidrug transport system, ATPase component
MQIIVKNISKKFKKVTVLNNVNMTFESGKIYGLVGRNGSGKSVFLKILCSFYKPNTGEVLFDNINYSSNNSFPPDTRALIEKPTFFPDLTGFENLKLLANIQNKISDNEINDTLEKVNLINEKNKKYKEYSLGMKQKLGIAQVLMENPNVMIFDELFNGIEDDTVDKIRNILLELKNQNKIIIVTSHIKEDIDILSDEVYKFNNGNVERIK